MSRDEIREIAKIVGDDKFYSHFVRRINKEFEQADEERNSNVYVLFEEDARRNRVGFSVIGHSPAKMRVWEKIFKEEGWVDKNFKMKTTPFELMYMYVKPAVRGKRHGVSLFKKTTFFTRKKGIKEIYAYVSDRNSLALDFYKRMKAEVIRDFSDEEVTAAFLRWRLN